MFLYILMYMLQDPMILDPTSERSDVKNKLERMLSKMDELQKLAFTFKSYQKNFKACHKSHRLSNYSIYIYIYIYSLV